MFKHFIIVLLSLASLQTGLDCLFMKHRIKMKETKEVVNCTNSGLMCTSCNQVVLCINNGDGQFQKLETETCNLDKKATCLNGTCTTDFNPSCIVEAKIPFFCEQKGMFPDPYNCKKYHICYSSGKSNENMCDKDHGYDPLSTYCKIPLVNSSCSSTPIPQCKINGQLGAIEANPSIYYICHEKKTTDNKQVLYPVQYLCPNGNRFEKNRCEAGK